MPPANTPLVASYDALAERARAGDVRASCRLAQELEHCEHLAVLRWTAQLRGDFGNVPSTGDTAASRKELDRLVEMRARQQESMDRLGALCAGVTQSRTQERFDWLLLAAEQGSVGAASYFARNAGHDYGHMFEHLDRLPIFRERAPEFARRALEGGDPAIVVELADAYGTPADAPMRSLLAQLVQPDPVEAYALWRLHIMIIEPSTDELAVGSIEKLAKKLTPAQRQAGDARAASLRAGSFAGAAAPRADRWIDEPTFCPKD